MAKASEISIRDGVPTDAEAISRVIIQALRDTNSKDYSSAVGATRPRRRKCAACHIPEHVGPRRLRRFAAYVDTFKSADGAAIERMMKAAFAGGSGGLRARILRNSD